MASHVKADTIECLAFLSRDLARRGAVGLAEQVLEHALELAETRYGKRFQP